MGVACLSLISLSKRVTGWNFFCMFLNDCLVFRSWMGFFITVVMITHHFRALKQTLSCLLSFPQKREEARPDPEDTAFRPRSLHNG